MRLQLSASSSEAAPGSSMAAGGGGAAWPEDVRGRSPLSASNDLMGNSLASYFSQLFEKPSAEELQLGEKR